MSLLETPRPKDTWTRRLRRTRTMVSAITLTAFVIGAECRAIYDYLGSTLSTEDTTQAASQIRKDGSGLKVADGWNYADGMCLPEDLIFEYPVPRSGRLQLILPPLCHPITLRLVPRPYEPIPQLATIPTADQAH